MTHLTLTLSPRCGERGFVVAMLVLTVACHAPTASREAAEAAESFARNHQLQVSVAGSDCRVLLISSETAFDDDRVESIHYETDGAEQFAHDHGFRAVIYRDSTDNYWTYGATTQDEARSLPHCR